MESAGSSGASEETKVSLRPQALTGKERIARTDPLSRIAR
jgi:hypothetical protein